MADLQFVDICTRNIASLHRSERGNSHIKMKFQS